MYKSTRMDSVAIYSVMEVTKILMEVTKILKEKTINKMPYILIMKEK